MQNHAAKKPEAGEPPQILSHFPLMSSEALVEFSCLYKNVKGARKQC